MMSPLILLAFFSSTIFAAETLNEIEVSAAKEVNPYTFSQTETITAEEISQQPLPLLSQALERVPGLVSSQNGGPGGRTTFFIRGTEARHVSFTLDGLKLNDPSNTDRQFDAAFLTLTAIDEILVHKGPQAVLYGSDAMGGHIEMRTRKGSRNPEKKLTLTGGSFGTLGASYRQDWSQGTLSVVKQRTDGISRYNEKRFSGEERDGSDITNLTSSSRHGWTEKISTDLLASFIEGRNELDLAADTAKEISVNRQYILQQKSSVRLTKEIAVSLRNGLNRNERAIRSGFPTQSFEGDLIQNELLLETGNAERKLITGIALEQESLKLREEREFTLGSAFAQGIVKEGDYSFHLGGRADNHSRYGNFLTGGTGVELRSQTGTWSFQYSRGFKAPSLYQLYGPATTGFPNVGNRDLSPESNQSYEASWKLKAGAWELGNVLFQNRLSNLIIFSTTDGYRNQGRFIAEGVEPHFTWTGNSSQVRGSFTHQQFREEESKVLRRPYNMGQVSASWFPTEASEGFVKGRWFDSRRDSDFSSNTIKLNGFETLDVGGTYRWNKQEISLQIVNIFDRDYEELYGFSVMPRSIFGSYGVMF